MRAFIFLLDEQVRDALVETAGTSATEVGKGTGSGDGSRTPILFVDDLASDRLVGTTGDSPREKTTAVRSATSTTPRQMWLYSMEWSR